MKRSRFSSARSPRKGQVGLSRFRLHPATNFSNILIALASIALDYNRTKTG